MPALDCLARVSLCTLWFVAACSGESQPPPKLSAAEVADLVTQKVVTDCPGLSTADGWVGTSTSKKSGLDLVSRSVHVVDRQARRTFSRKATRTGDGSTSFLAGTTANGSSWRCFSAGSDHCTLEPVAPQPAYPAGIPAEKTLAYMSFGDFNQPSHGGAAVAFDPAPSDVEGAVWKLSVTPKGGIAYILHVARDGATLAVDAPWLGQRTANLDWETFGGCRVPSEIRSDLSGKSDRQTTVTNFEVRPKMSPADTPTEGEVELQEAEAER